MDTFEEVILYTKEASGYENSADENIKREKKTLARKHPIKSILPDLSQTIKKIKTEVKMNGADNEYFSSPSTSSSHQQVDLSNSNIIFEDMNATSVQSNQHQYQDQEILDAVREISYEDSGINHEPKLILIDENSLKTALQILGTIQQDIKFLNDAVLTDNPMNKTSGFLIKKIASKEDLDILVHQLEDENKKLKLINILKLKGGMSGFHDDINAKVATIIYFLFDKEILKKMNWGAKNGVPRSDQLCLIDFPIIMEIMRAVLSKENEKGEAIFVDELKLRTAIQNVFKNHIHKNKHQ
ncbi:hypothetical protein ACKWTF_016399 [Chironomus riparius]